MYENPNDELYFGEVYRQVLQEAWLPEGSEEWMRTGKSRRGWRPTQRGIGEQSPSLSQAQVRRCFSLCGQNWREMPDKYPADHPCADIPGKDFWWQQKLDRGVMCSYYDLYMRYCLYHCFRIGCPPEDIVCWAWDPDSTKETIHGYWAGIYVLGGFAPYQWSVNDPPFWIQAVITSIRANGITTREDRCGIANITVTDFCGRTVEGVVTTPDVPWPYFPPTWSDSNSDEINRNSSQKISIDHGVPPFKWEIGGDGFTLEFEETEDRDNRIYASPTACGYADISFTDCLYNYGTGSILCDAGSWILKSEGVCQLPGVFTTQSGPGQHTRRVRNTKQNQDFGTVCSASGDDAQGNPLSCANPSTGCNTPGYMCSDHQSCVSSGCAPCVTGLGIPDSFGCADTDPGVYHVDCVRELKYWEYEC